MNRICVSVISHGHGAMVSRLVGQLLKCPEVTLIVLTKNIPENFVLPGDSRIILISNLSPKGFAANHNAAFKHCTCTEKFFCPLNPDIELSGNPFTPLLETLCSERAAVVAPVVVAKDGQVEDSVRHFPTLRLLFGKALGKSDGRYCIVLGQPAFCPEWVAGMFMLFRSDDFAILGGFDEGFFLYYEDVDICARAWNARMKIVASPSVSVIHDARRASRKDFGYMRWHMASMARFFWKHWGRLPRIN